LCFSPLLKRGGGGDLEHIRFLLYIASVENLEVFKSPSFPLFLRGKHNKNLMTNLLPLYDAVGLGEFSKNIAKNMQPVNEKTIINLGKILY